MNNLRPIEAAEKATESVKNKARGKLIDWLPHHSCDNCGAICTAENEYVERQAMAMPVWKCPECESRFHRDADTDKHSADMWNR